MVKILKKFFCIIVSLSLFFTLFNSNLVHADSISDGQAAQIISIEVPSDVQSYAVSILPYHLNGVKKTPIEYGFKDCNISKITLGNPFNIYKYSNEEVVNTGVYYFSVLYNGNIKATLAVTKDKNGSLTSTFSKGFSSNLNKILHYNKNKKYRLFDIENEIRAIDSDNALFVSDDKFSENSSKEISVNIINKINNLNKSNIDNKKYKECYVEPLQVNNNSNNISPNSFVGPTSYKYLSVPYVPQDGYNICWAATCASIINFKKNLTLSAEKVYDFVYPHDPTYNQGGDYTDELKAYNNWGLYPHYYNSDITWTNATNELNTGNPIDSGWYDGTLKINGHAMTVRGYEYYSDSGRRIYLLIDPNSGYVSTTGQTYSGDCVYTLGGTNYYWMESILGF